MASEEQCLTDLFSKVLLSPETSNDFQTPVNESSHCLKEITDDHPETLIQEDISSNEVRTELPSSFSSCVATEVVHGTNPSGLEDLFDPNCNEVLKNEPNVEWEISSSKDRETLEGKEYAADEDLFHKNVDNSNNEVSSQGTKSTFPLNDERAKENLKIFESAQHDCTKALETLSNHPVVGNIAEDVFSLKGRCGEFAVISNIPTKTNDLHTKNLNVISSTNDFISTSSLQNSLQIKEESLVSSVSNLFIVKDEIEARDKGTTEEDKSLVVDVDFFQGSKAFLQGTWDNDREISKDESNTNFISGNKTVIAEGNSNNSEIPLEVSDKSKKPLDLVIDVPKNSDDAHLQCLDVKDNNNLLKENTTYDTAVSAFEMGKPCEKNSNTAEIIGQMLKTEIQELTVEDQAARLSVSSSSSSSSSLLLSSVDSAYYSDALTLDEENNALILLGNDDVTLKTETIKQESSSKSQTTKLISTKSSVKENIPPGSHSQDIMNDIILNFETDSSNSISGNIISLTNVIEEVDPNYLPPLRSSDWEERLNLSLESEVKTCESRVDKKEFDARKPSHFNIPGLKPERGKDLELRKTSLLSHVTLPTISEKSAAEEEQNKDSNTPTEFNLQNSPVLRRTRTGIEGRPRKDCRSLFNEEPSDIDSEEMLDEKQQFRSLRDSLDISKRSHLSSDALQKDKNVTGEDILNQNKPQKISQTEVRFKTEPSSTEKMREKPIHEKPLHYVGKSLSYKVCVTGDKEGGRRRVSFPEDDSRLITSYLEPVNPWHQMNVVSTNDISEAYKNSCERHKTRALPVILHQIAALPVGIGRIECLSIRNYKLEAVQCECLEEIFRRVQFQTLDFEGCELDDDAAIPLFDMIEFYDSAMQLNISANNKIGSRGWQVCARMLKRAHSLRMLEARNTNLSEQNMPIICKALRLGTRLHTLHLENCNLTGRPLVNLAGALRLNDTITDLYLADNRLGVNDCIQLGNLVRANKTLKLLDLRNNNIQDSGCTHICKDIAEQQTFQRSKAAEEGSTAVNAGLTTLVLWNNHITVHAIPYFSLMLHANITLETLNMGRNNLTSEGVLLLKNSLIRNRSLKRLGLQATRIGNEGAVALAECIADNNVIARIDLRENSIQVAGLLALCRSLKINTAVVQLDLDANPRAESCPELSDQHWTLHHEIKTLCQRNQTNAHLKDASEKKKEENGATAAAAACDIITSPEKRKISLTCDTINRPVENEKPTETPVGESSKRYWSPAPSPSVSPCPSPSLSPSPSPMTSPLRKNPRFKVSKVSEEGGGSPSSTLSLSPVTTTSVLSASAPAFFMHNSMGGSLPSLMPSTKPNRFSAGRRFTVTKVREPSSPFKSSLPGSRAMSSPSLIAPLEKESVAPTIVVSSPNKAVRGFSVDDSQSDLSLSSKHDLSHQESSSSLDLPVVRIRSNSSSSSSNSPSGSDSPQDDVFTNPSEGDEPKAGRETLQPKDEGTGGPHAPSGSPKRQEVIQRAPLASVEAGSFDSDSEDGEVTTQSSDSTLSDEVRISSTEQTPPIHAWGAKSPETKSPNYNKDANNIQVLKKDK